MKAPARIKPEPDIDPREIKQANRDAYLGLGSGDGRDTSDLAPAFIFV